MTSQRPDFWRFQPKQLTERSSVSRKSTDSAVIYVWNINESDKSRKNERGSEGVNKMLAAAVAADRRKHHHLTDESDRLENITLRIFSAVTKFNNVRLWVYLFIG